MVVIVLAATESTQERCDHDFKTPSQLQNPDVIPEYEPQKICLIPGSHVQELELELVLR